MFEKTQKAANELGAAVTADATNALAVAKAAVIPAVSGFFGKIASAAQSVAEGVADGSLFKPAEAPKAEAKVEADPLPTPEENTAIHTMRQRGQTDEQIAHILGVSVRTVKMAY